MNECVCVNSCDEGKFDRRPSKFRGKDYMVSVYDVP